MSDTPAKHDRDWLRARIWRHTHELFRLAWPAMLARAGIITLAFIDTVMVGHYSTSQLAYLSIGNGTLVSVVLVIGIGLLYGTLVFTARAHGKGDFEACGRIWRRSMVYAALAGLVGMALCLPGESFLTLSGQEATLAREGGAVMAILGLGLPAHLFYVTSILFLEGIERSKPGMYAIVAANLLNIVLDYGLIYGRFGFPELGAQGSAWATTILRICMSGALVIYILNSPALAPYKTRGRFRLEWRESHAQRHLGYAAGVSVGAEVAAFAVLSLFAGLMGELPLAAYGVLINVVSLPFMLAVGIGTATSVRVGIAHSRDDPQDTSLAGWTGVGLMSLILGLIAIVGAQVPELIVALYSTDPAVIALAGANVVLAASFLVFDGGQVVISSALRGLGERWWPTMVQSFAYIVVMIPLGWVMAFGLGHGVRGLIEAILVASVVSSGLLALLFHRGAAAGAAEKA